MTLKELREKVLALPRSADELEVVTDVMCSACLAEDVWVEDKPGELFDNPKDFADKVVVVG